MDLGLRGKTALVTGASRGIGKAIAEAIAREGCHVHLAARDGALLQTVCAQIADRYGVQAHPHARDLSNTAEVEALGKDCGEVDILVNNAGGIPRGTIFEVDGAIWRRAWDLKVFGFIDLTRIVLGRMMQRGRGSIVNVIGAKGEAPDWNYIAGCSGNAALIAFTHAIGAESVRKGVRVNCVNPGPIMSDRFMQGLLWRAKRNLGDESRWQEQLDYLPIKRAGAADEVAAAVAFLASDVSSYTSGASLRIDAGLIHRSPAL
jgi:NAD(P)-dependent dehydrogenase (short-subunit alcohol dehydrogenase family)